MSTVEIPAHVRHESYVQNKISVVGGTNWDLSRTAIETPIVAVVDPVPAPVIILDPTPSGYGVAHQMPSSAAALDVKFKQNSVLLSKQEVAEMRALPKRSRVLVAGHADVQEKAPAKLALRRAQAVAAQLKKHGHKVVEIRSFGSEVPKSFKAEDAAMNRHVEVYEK